MRKAEKKTKQGLIRLLKRLSPWISKAPFNGPCGRILILGQEKLGDAILMTSLIRGLRQILPGAEIDVAAMSILKSPVFAFFENDPDIHTVWHVKENYFAFLKQAGRRRYDVLINTKDHPSFNFLILTVLIGARYKAGLDHPGHHGFYHWLAGADFHQPMASKYAELLGFLSHEKPESRRPSIPPGPVTGGIRSVSAQLKGRHAIGINLSAGHPAREWPVSSWRRLIEKISEPVVVFSMPGRLADKQTLEKEFSQVIPTPETASVFDVAALMTPLEMLISPDTSLIHIASATVTPVIGLYTCEIVHQKRFAPFQIPYQRVISPDRTVAGIPVEAVLDAIKNLRTDGK